MAGFSSYAAGVHSLSFERLEQLESFTSDKSLERLSSVDDVDEEDLDRKFVLRRQARSQMLKRVTQEDERVDYSGEALSGHVFSAGDFSGVLDTWLGKVRVQGYRDESHDLGFQTVRRIASAAMYWEDGGDQEKSLWRSALEEAGIDYSMHKAEEDYVQDAAADFLEEIGYTDFHIDIEESTQDTYEEAVERIIDEKDN